MDEQTHQRGTSPGGYTASAQNHPSYAQLQIVAWMKAIGTTHARDLRNLTGLSADQLQAEVDELQSAGLVRRTDSPGLDITNMVFSGFGERLYRLTEGYAGNPYYQQYFGAQTSARSSIATGGPWEKFESAVWRYFTAAYAVVLVLYICRVLADLFYNQPLGGLATADEVYGLVCPVLALAVASARHMPVFADSGAGADSRVESAALGISSRVGLLLVPVTFVIAAVPEAAVVNLIVAAMS